MLEFHSICEFSRTNCAAICAFLVPANMLATLQTMILIGLNRSSIQLVQSIVIATFLAVMMILHVYTWFMIGVVMIPTYILLSLGSVCLAINLWAVVHPASMMVLLRNLWFSATRSLKLVK